MSSSMLAGERKWSSSRRGGMTVLGKVAVPKPINLPSQKLENHGLDPNVEIVPKGSLSWGSRPSSSTSNPWGSSAASPNADGTTASPHHPSGRPTSSGGLSRPSTAGSDRHDSTWGPNSRPSSASGVLTSNQTPLTSRPLSADTRPGSSHLSRFAEPAYDNSGSWGPNGTADKLSIPSKANDFSLTSGDFPTLGSEKDNTTKSGEPHDHGSHVRPGSGSGRHAPVKDEHKSGTVDTWTRDGSSHFDEGVRPNADNWQRDPHQYGNPNVPPQHYDAWQGPPMNGPPPGVWYRGPPPAGPPYPHVPHGGYPMEPYPYYHPQMPPPLSNSQSGPPPGPGPRGHHPRNGDFYRPQMPDAFIHPGMPPMRPGFYPGPVPYDGYYGPPMGYNHNDRDMPYMGMPPGPHGPPVYNMRPPQNPSEHNDSHFRGGPGGVRGPVGNMFVSEQMDSHSHPHGESHGPYKVLRKHENERNADMEEDSWEQNIEKNDHPRPSFYKNERGPDIRRNEDMSSRRNMHTNQGYPSDPVTVHASQGPHKSKASNESWGNKSSFSEDSKDSTLIQKIEDLNVKARASDIRGDTEQVNKLLINPKSNSTIAFGSISATGDLAHPHDNSRQAHLGVRTRADHHTKGRLSNQDTDGWRKKPSFQGSEAAASENHISIETKDTGESLSQVNDSADGQAQRARMRELAKQRAIELQKEEEERIKEQKAKAQAKLEELNRRTLAAADGTIQVAEKNNTSVSEQEDVDGSKKPTEPATDSKAEVATQISEISQRDPVDQSMHSKQSDTESKATHGNDVGVTRPKRASHRQKQSVQVVEGTVDKSTLSVTGGEVITNLASSVVVSGEAVQSQESTQQKKRNNKSSKNKHKLDDASASRDVDLVKPESPPLDPNPTTMTVTDNKDAKPHADQHKPQHSKRTPRNPQANRFHVGDVAVWAPVRPHNKEETAQDNIPLPEKAINSSQTNLKSKRAEMERYVPKPVAKELAQQGTVIQSISPSSPKKPALEDTTDTQAIPVPSNVGPTKSVDNKQQQQQVKPHVASRQRNQQDSKKGFHKSTSQSDQSNPIPVPVPVSTETNAVHEWDPSDGWFMPDEYPPTEITPAPAPVVKDEGGITNKGKKPAYKGQRNTVKEVEVDQTDRPASSKENRSSHWQPKPQLQAYKGGWSGGGQTANSEVKRESRKYSQPDESVHDQGHQEGRRERKPASFRGRDQNQGYGNMEDEAQFDQQQQHHVSSGFRKYGGQNNNRSSGQDDKRKHNNYQQYANVNREKPRQNMQYEYQPVGSTNNNNNNNNNNYNNNNKSSHLDAHADAAPRYKERGTGQPRRGGGDFYGRNH